MSPMKAKKSPSKFKMVPAQTTVTEEDFSILVQAQRHFKFPSYGGFLRFILSSYADSVSHKDKAGNRTLGITQ